MRRLSVEVTTAADGTAIAYSPRFSGLIHSVVYQKVDFADGVDFAITTERTAQGLWTESNVNAAASRYPRAPTHNQVGAAALYAADGLGVLEKVPVGNDRVKISIAQGGNTKSGTFHILVG